MAYTISWDPSDQEQDVTKRAFLISETKQVDTASTYELLLTRKERIESELAAMQANLDAIQSNLNDTNALIAEVETTLNLP